MKTTLAYLLILLTALTACTAGKPAYRIGVSQCSEGRWRQKVNSEMLAAQHLYDTNVQVDIVQAHDDTRLQIRQIDSLAQTGIDLLVVAPNESAPVAEAIGRVLKRGIPVIYFDRKATNADYTAFIGGNNVEAGKTMGDYVLSVLGRTTPARRPLVLEITGAMTTSPARERHRGFAQAMQGHPELDYESRDGNWTSDAACRLVKEQINSGRLPDVVFCHNDGMATGVYKAVVETGTEGRILIAGIDGMPGEGLEYVAFGHQIGTYIYPTHGEEIVRLALDILEGKPYKRDHELQGILVTPDNVASLAATSGELQEQIGNLVTIQDKLESYLGLYNVQRTQLVVSLVTVGLLALALIVLIVAFVQTKRNTRQRQAMNEEQTLFNTNASSRKLRQMFVVPEEDEPAPRSQDAIFADKLNAAVRRHMSNPNLKMEDLGDELKLSRVQLYRKVKALTGLSPVELLRQMRLQQGYALLGSTTKTVAEVAFECGFNTPSYFSKCFKEQYGKYPTDLRQE